MKLNEYNKYSRWATIILLLVIVPILTFYIGKKYQETKIVLDSEINKEITSKQDEVIEEYEIKCPYSEMDGITYRQCLYDLVESKYKQIDDQYASVVKEVKIVMQNDLKQNQDNNDNNARQGFLDNLEKYHMKFKDFITTDCVLDASIFWGGTAQSEIISICEIKEIDKYSKRLQDYKEEWIKDFTE
jgi:hypothetical protein